jgi:hypothetical protein
VQAVQQALERLAEIEEEMPAIGDLQRRRGAGCDTPRILGRAVTCNHFNPWMPAEPCGKGLSRAIWEHVDGPPLLQIDQQGAIDAPFPHREVIHPQDPRRRSGDRWSVAHNTEEGIGADLQVQVDDHPGAGLAAQREAQNLQGPSQAKRPLGPHRHHRREALSEGPLGTVQIAAEKASDAQDKARRAITHGEVTRCAGIAAMDTCGGPGTSWTTG